MTNLQWATELVEEAASTITQIILSEYFNSPYSTSLLYYILLTYMSGECTEYLRQLTK